MRAHTGFLGVMLENMFQPIGPLEASPDNDATGVLIQDGVPGYCGYRFLHVGDVVMGVISNEQIIRTSLDVELRQTVQAIGPRRPITLQLLRQGKVIRVTFALDLPPNLPGLGKNAVEEFRNRRHEKAEVYWENAFGLLLDQGWS